MDQEFVRGAEVGLDLEGKELLAALTRRLEDGQGEDLLVQVEGDVAAELLGIVQKNLEKKQGKASPKRITGNPNEKKPFHFVKNR